jgi:hypothetical protein
VARTVGWLDALERVFPLGRDVYMSDQSTGRFFRLENGAFSPVARKHDRYFDEVITCTASLGDDTTLVGTVSIGLQRYDENGFRPFVSHGSLAGAHRINDLCDAGDGLVAVALDNVGVVFIDRTGRIVQSLDRSVDNRLARVKH